MKKKVNNKKIAWFTWKIPEKKIACPAAAGSERSAGADRDRYTQFRGRNSALLKYSGHFNPIHYLSIYIYEVYIMYITTTLCITIEHCKRVCVAGWMCRSTLTLSLSLTSLSLHNFPFPLPFKLPLSFLTSLLHNLVPPPHSSLNYSLCCFISQIVA